MILVKTEAGQQSFKDRSVRLTPRQRSAFILCDGTRSVLEVQSAGMGITREDLDQMIELGMLAPSAGFQVAPAPAAPAPLVAVDSASVPSVAPDPAAIADAEPMVLQAATPASARTTQQRYQDAYPIATRLTSSLGLRGFRLNLSVEGTSTYEELLALAPKIRAAVGPDKAADLDRALGS